MGKSPILANSQNMPPLKRRWACWNQLFSALSHRQTKQWTPKEKNLKAMALNKQCIKMNITV